MGFRREFGVISELSIAPVVVSAVALGLFSAWLVGDFVFAVVIGYLVGRANLWVRSRVTDAAVNTVISFTVPFLAAVPSEMLGASGLVAAVVAGLVTGRVPQTCRTRVARRAP